MSHLILDEIWSIEFKRGMPHLKSSFGTAMKFWGPAMGPNFLTYALLGALTFVCAERPLLDEPIQLAQARARNRPARHGQSRLAI